VVKVGFIVEGESEKIILESESFRSLLTTLKVDFIPDVVDATGSGNILPQNRDKYVQILKDKGATKIIYLVDREEEPCITTVKERIKPGTNETVVVSIKALEAWFLADSIMLSALFKKNYSYNSPEETVILPRDVLQNEFLENTGQGLGRSKPRTAKKMVKSGFSIISAASHEKCNSAKYFLQKLKEHSQN